MELVTWNKKKELREKWWNDRREKYNIGLILSGIIAFIIYALVVEFIVPSSEGIEITIFTIIFQGIGYLFMIGIANIFYNLGAIIENVIEPKNKEQFRKLTFNIGFWFSCGLPFLIPLILLITYI